MSSKTQRSESKGISLHIGLNFVDPDAYSGWDGELAGCINDATDMKSIADGLGYSSLMLIDSDATSDRVIQEIGSAAQELVAGDIFLLTYSGHGGQVPDVNGDEDDEQDETWVLWDRQLIDDELYALWSRFAAGVRIFMLSDSCHSGTVARMMATLNELTTARKSKDLPVEQARERAAQELARALGFSDVRPKGRRVETRAAATAPSLQYFRVMPPDVRTVVNRARASENAAAQYVAGPSEQVQIDASVILISGCQDSQLSSDGDVNGLFTEKVKEVWNGGQFTGDYRQFWSEIAATMPDSQSPNFDTVGASDPAFEKEIPFTIAHDGSAVQSDPVSDISSTSDTASTRPTLQLGDRGSDVMYLQERLIAFGYEVTADGEFDQATENAVNDFQESHGIEVTGIVDSDTWQALEQRKRSGPVSRVPRGTRATLRYGAKGPEVKYLQKRLNAFGFYLKESSVFDQLTQSAVRSFQASNGLPVDGEVGSSTWISLEQGAAPRTIDRSTSSGSRQPRPAPRDV